MGNNEGEKLVTEKAASPPREHSTVHVYPDWAVIQAYYGPGPLPPPYFNPTVTSGHPVQPYMWPPPQMMAPYGSPYAAMYPHGGIYGPSAAPIDKLKNMQGQDDMDTDRKDDEEILDINTENLLSTQSPMAPISKAKTNENMYITYSHLYATQSPSSFVWQRDISKYKLT